MCIRDSNKTLAIKEIPYGKTVASVCDSIVKASEKGKIKIRKVEDLTYGSVEILVHLAPGVSSDKTIDALYAFTDCEVSISPNCCVCLLYTSSRERYKSQKEIVGVVQKYRELGVPLDGIIPVSYTHLNELLGNEHQHLGRVLSARWSDKPLVQE